MKHKDEPRSQSYSSPRRRYPTRSRSRDLMRRKTKTYIVLHRLNPTTSLALNDAYVDEFTPTTSLALKRIENDAYVDEFTPTTSLALKRIENDAYVDEFTPTTSLNIS